MTDPEDEVRVDEHQACVRGVVLVARALDIYDIPKAIEAATRALEMGPYIDPTAWRDNHKKLEEDREMLRLALPLWELVQKLWRDVPGGQEPSQAGLLDLVETMGLPGTHPKISRSNFPEQGKHLGKRVYVAFHYGDDGQFISPEPWEAGTLEGTIVRDDVEDGSRGHPRRTIIRIDDGRHVLATECQCGIKEDHDRAAAVRARKD